MSRDDVLPDEPIAEARAFRWSSLFGWGFFVGLGLLVWEFTDQSGLAICVACTKFGWDNLATAVWLHDRDPVRPRYRGCSLFFAANAFRNIGLTAFLVTYAGSKLMALVDWWQGKPQVLPAINWAWVHISIAAVCGIVAWWFLGGIAAVVAWHSRSRVWVDPTLHLFRRTRSWPPEPWGRNQVRLTATLGIAFHLFFWLILPIHIAVGFRDWAVWSSLPLGLPAGWFIAQRIAARTPEECWPRGPRAKLTIETVYSGPATR
ncbi:MAG: hypothetical protein U0992_01055 [Planctomycetaceae bacterium]